MREKELRLALVCYGGISLAVYMHGITGEIWRLVRASCAFQEGHAPASGSQNVYAHLLEEIERETGTRVRVLVDIIAGASAGGINGIFLAQAIATGQSLDPLTQMWLEKADIEALMADEAMPQRFSKMWAMPLAWMASRRAEIDATVEPGTRNEVHHKLQHFIRSRWFDPPFGGAKLTHMVLDAFDAMATGDHGPRLLPEGQPLDLFITVTDFGGHPERLRLNSPPEVLETEHRLVFSFRDTGQGSVGDPVGLAFAARATSSFPGAFPPMTVNEIDTVTAARGVDWTARDGFLSQMLPRQYAANALDSVVLIDGSVLANAPFGPAIAALRERPARRQVDRRFVYVDPVPGFEFNLGLTKAETPGFFQTIISALSELPRQQPIRDNLEAIEARSDRIARVRSVLSGLRGEVEALVTGLFGYTLFLDWPTTQRLTAWRRRAQQHAARSAGFAYAAYARLKVADVTAAIAETLVRAGTLREEQARRLREAVQAEIRQRGVDTTAAAELGGSSPVVDYLRTFDLGFRIRRLRLLARRLSESDIGDEAVLAPVREAIYASLADYLELQRSDHFLALADEVRAFDGDPAPLLDRLATAMNLRALDRETDRRLSAGLSALPKEHRRPLLLTYLGFPFFDIATLPLLEGEGLDEFDPVKVDRISPDDAHAIREGGAAATLKGIQFYNFGAFFSRAYRENDYLWGRLHGADRLIDIVVSTLPEGVRLGPGRVTAIKHAAFHAILDAEEPRLTAIPHLFVQLRREIGPA